MGGGWEARVVVRMYEVYEECGHDRNGDDGRLAGEGRSPREVLVVVAVGNGGLLASPYIPCELCLSQSVSRQPRATEGSTLSLPRRDKSEWECESE